MRWEDWSRGTGGWTKPVKLADGLPNIKIVVSCCELDEPEDYRYANVRAFVTDENHPECPAFNGDNGWIGGGSPVLETYWLDIADSTKRGVLAKARHEVEASLTNDKERAQLAECLRGDLAEAAEREARAQTHRRRGGRQQKRKR